MAVSDKSNLICLHGALGSARQLEAALKPFSKHANVHFFDFPGHGMLAANQLTIDNCVSTAHEYLLKNNLAGSTLFGFSMGGYVALMLAQRYPELVGQVITLGTKWDWNPRVAESEIKKLEPDVVLEKVPRYAEALQNWHGDGWKKVMAQTAELMQDLSEHPHFNDDVYQTIQHPVLLCRAVHDDFVTREETIHAAWMLPNGEFAQVLDSKHPIEKVNMEVLWKLISSVV
jgi:pimeloyl-ACP methyl ester carboxylesterase